MYVPRHTPGGRSVSLGDRGVRLSPSLSGSSANQHLQRYPLEDCCTPVARRYMSMYILCVCMYVYISGGFSIEEREEDPP